MKIRVLDASEVNPTLPIQGIQPGDPDPTVPARHFLVFGNSWSLSDPNGSKLYDHVDQIARWVEVKLEHESFFPQLTSSILVFFRVFGGPITKPVPPNMLFPLPVKGSAPVPTLQQVLAAGNDAWNKIANLLDPTLNQDAATKAYVDSHQAVSNYGVFNSNVGTANPLRVFPVHTSLPYFNWYMILAVRWHYTGAIMEVPSIMVGMDWTGLTPAFDSQEQLFQFIDPATNLISGQRFTTNPYIAGYAATDNPLFMSGSPTNEYTILTLRLYWEHPIVPCDKLIIETESMSNYNDAFWHSKTRCKVDTSAVPDHFQFTPPTNHVWASGSHVMVYGFRSSFP